jgi:hypothetical protein
VQCPSALCKAQLRQAPVHALSQQTPSTHCFDWHWLAVVHVEPSCFSPQDPPMHVFGEMQSLSAVHLVAQASVEHM